DIHRTPSLFKGHPEEDARQGKDNDDNKPVAYHLRGWLFHTFCNVRFNGTNSFRTAFASLFWRLTKHAEKALRIVKLQHPEKHEDTGQAKAPMPTNLLAD